MSKRDRLWDALSNEELQSEIEEGRSIVEELTSEAYEISCTNNLMILELRAREGEEEWDGLL